MHQAPPLTLSPTLTTYAQNWADGGVYEHSNGPYGVSSLAECDVFMQFNVGHLCHMAVGQSKHRSETKHLFLSVACTHAYCPTKCTKQPTL